MTGAGARHPTVAVLVAHWESRSEPGWITRQVAGVLACTGDVHVITPDGPVPGSVVDGPFTVHRLATPIDTEAERRRDLLIEALAATGSAARRSDPARIGEVLDRGLTAPWSGATAVLNEVRPDLIVIAGHLTIGALEAVDRADGSVPITLVALASSPGALATPHFARVVERADSVLTVTEDERQAVIAHHGAPDRVHRIGAPLAANPSARSEPNTWVGTTDYILVVTNSGSEEAHPETELSRLIRLRFPDNPVGVCHTDSFCAWHEGRLSQGWAVERASDMARLMAWARVTVDLHPGGLYARRCVESLLYGTPLVVPAISRAREHAQRGGGGLWFDSAAELTWCIEALLEPGVRSELGGQGKAYAEEEYGSTDRFIERVTAACGLADYAGEAPVTA
jgi:hypothetical protein